MNEKKTTIARAIWGLLLLVFVLLPQLKGVGNYVISLLFTLFIFIVLAQSWNLMGGYAGQFNLGLAAYFGSGVFCWSILYQAGLSPYLAIIAGGLAAVLVAVVIGVPSLRLKGIYFSIGTLAMAEALRIIIGSLFPSSINVPASYWENFNLLERYYLALALLVVTMGAVYGLTSFRIGFALRAIRDEEDAARATGINPTKYKIIVFVISSFFTGLAGGLFAYNRGLITPVYQFLPDWSFGPLMAACIGGLGTIVGPVLGSLIFVVLQELFSQTLGKAHFIVTGAFFIVVILFLPRGLVLSGLPLKNFLLNLFRGKPI